MRKIAVLDLETDPFEYGQMIQPFLGGFYDGERYITFWSMDCIQRLVAFLESEKTPMVIYAHNGGRFDFFYFLKYFKTDLKIVNSRIISAKLGIHELRDSFAIMPFPLAAYKKTDIAYEKFKREVRENHREEIIAYLRDDCVDLYTLVTSFIAEFGDKLTIGSASMKQLAIHHKVSKGNEEYDTKFRKDFYFGGRNQVFESGVLNRAIKVFDVNSMYPFVMRDFLHPVGTGTISGRHVNEDTTFVIVTGHNDGAFPVREKDGSLNFTRPYGTFHTTIHEYNAAVETGAFRPVRIIKTLGNIRRETFAEFITHFYDARLKAKAAGDKIRTLFYKFVMNSAYGKFALNPENYSDWRITAVGEFPSDWHECQKSCTMDCRLKWAPSFMANDYIIWSRPLVQKTYYNIATGASITGAARAVLLRGLRASTRPIYCDTDSIICSDLPRDQVDDNALGRFKLEATGTMAAICGKKLYAIFDSEGTCIKKAHKGARLTGDEILRIARGEKIETCNPVPSFKFDGSYSFTKRIIQRTGVVT